MEGLIYGIRNRLGSELQEVVRCEEPLLDIGALFYCQYLNVAYQYWIKDECVKLICVGPSRYTVEWFALALFAFRPQQMQRMINPIYLKRKGLKESSEPWCRQWRIGRMHRPETTWIASLVFSPLSEASFNPRTCTLGLVMKETRL